MFCLQKARSLLWFWKVKVVAQGFRSERHPTGPARQTCCSSTKRQNQASDIKRGHHASRQKMEVNLALEDVATANDTATIIEIDETDT
jgi:hypothetical protein